jgi:hypothetical protein
VPSPQDLFPRAAQPQLNRCAHCELNRGKETERDEHAG